MDFTNKVNLFIVWSLILKKGILDQNLISKITYNFAISIKYEFPMKGLEKKMLWKIYAEFDG